MHMRNQQKLFFKAFCDVFGEKSIYSIMNETKRFKIKSNAISQPKNSNQYNTLSLNVVKPDFLSITYECMSGLQVMESYTAVILLRYSNTQQNYEKELNAYLSKIIFMMQ